MPYKNGDIKGYELNKLGREMLELAKLHYVSHQDSNSCRWCETFVSFLNMHNLALTDWTERARIIAIDGVLKE